MRPSLCLVAIAALPLIVGDVLAKGSNMRSSDMYEPQHIEGLPVEARQRVLALCPDSKALHAFATYTNHLQKLVLHFEHLYCGGKPFCGPSGCLHQTYLATGGGHYRLVESYYAKEPQ